jgi:hypothetical protein
MATVKRIKALLVAQDMERLMARLSRNVQHTDTGCIEWAGARNNDGYAKLNFRMEGEHVQVYAHRLFWVLSNKREIPSHLVLDHTCCNRACVNPAHLRLVAQKTNVRAIYQRRAANQGA